jgi:Uma2 family endonuclease
MPLYAQSGVRHLWAVDPVARTLEVFRNQGGHWVLIRTDGGDDVASAEPFEEIRISLERWWG